MKVLPHLSNTGRVASASLVFMVFLLHFAVGFALYRGRAVSRWPICDSDLVVFAGPFVLAVLAYGAVLFSSSWLRPPSALRNLSLLAISLLLVLLSTWCYMFFALNTYGS
jgi:hypothetical protein